MEKYKTGIEFMEASRYSSMGDTAEKKGIPQPALVLPAPDNVEIIPLPDKDSVKLPEMDLQQAIEQRRSVRKYKDEPISLEELSVLLWLTQGVKKVSKRPATLRTVPSAGCRHPFETYLLINRVESLEPGLYRFLPIEHAIYKIETSEDIAEKLVEACFNQKTISTSAATFFWATIIERTSWRYHMRSYRYVMLDAGHVCQNLYLAGETMNCGTCGIGAFYDELLNPLLGLDGEEQFVAYAATLGRKSD